jgi:hypothetical protein
MVEDVVSSEVKKGGTSSGGEMNEEERVENENDRREGWLYVQY